MAYLFCATFVFSTTRISALTVHRLQRDGFTGEGSASGFASSQWNVAICFNENRAKPLSDCLKNVTNQQTLISKWSLQACPEAACSPPAVMFCGGLWGSLQGWSRVFAKCILSWRPLWCLEWFPLFSPSLTWVLHFHLASQSGDTTEARSVSDRLHENSRWYTEDCEGWCKLPAQLPSMFLCLSLALFLPFSACCIKIHSQFWLLSWYLTVTLWCPKPVPFP